MRKSRDEFQARFTASWEESKCASNCARNTYISALHKAKAEHWKGWIEEAKERDVWIASKYTKNPLSDRSHACIPTLFKKGEDGQVTSELHTDAEKAALFTDLFFPPCPHTLPGSPEDSDPNPSPLKFTTPAPHQITRCINKTNPFKAPGEDGIPNLVLKKCKALLTPLLHTCLLAILNTGYFPKRWHSWKTIVLRKPGKPNYTIAKAYCPIALYDTMGKIISGVMTDIMVYLTVRHNLLPPRHFGGLPNRMTVDSLLYLTHWVKEAWHKRKVATIIFLDIANAFPNAVTNQLLQNMAKLGYPSEIISFFEAMLKDRKTTLSFDDFTSLPIDIDNGITQGETASMILYLIYSHGLVAIPQGSNEDGGANVDDNFFMAMADTFEECDRMLNNMLDKQAVWSVIHNSQAEISKFQCLRLTRCKGIARTDFVHRQTHHIIHCMDEAWLLGVQIHQEICWHQHVQQAIQKAEILLLAVN